MKRSNRTLLLTASLIAMGLSPATAVELDEVSVPYVFQSGTPARAEEVNANFLALTGGLSLVTDATEDVLERTAGGRGLVRVAPEGGDSSSIAEALTIAAASPESSLVLLYPGVYDEPGTLTVPGNVHLMGLDRQTTLVRVDALDGSRIAVMLESGAQLSGLTIVNETDEPFLVGIQAIGTGPGTLVDDVCVRAPEGSNVPLSALLVSDAEITVTRSELLADAPGGIGINMNDGKLVVESSVVVGEAFGVFSSNASETTLDLRDVDIRSGFRTIDISGSQTLARIEGGSLNEDLAPALRLVQASGAQVLVATTLLGPGTLEAANGGLIRFVHCYDFNYQPTPDSTLDS